ncbi:hypothetical protein FRC03_009989 [Tulasnella sp. 419]|nr:hypothetical protein FRC03_009989 [Tulasnella sp. 419]
MCSFPFSIIEARHIHFDPTSVVLNHPHDHDQEGLFGNTPIASDRTSSKKRSLTLSEVQNVHLVRAECLSLTYIVDRSPHPHRRMAEISQLDFSSNHSQDFSIRQTLFY